MYKNFEYVKNKLAGNTKSTSLALVILCLVHRILLQQGTNLVNKLALLLHKCWLKQDSRNKSENDRCWGRRFSLVASKQRSVAYGNKVMDTRLPQPAGCGDKYDICSVGRSMIEMLGVLAIIAVLSVGGIAGYSKAMEKWKLDKWKEDFVMMTANLSIHYMNSSKYVDSAQNLNTLFKELNIIPQNMLNEQNQDILGNYLYISSHTLPDLNIGLRISIRADTLPGNISFEQCKMLFEMLKEYENAWIVALNENHGYNAHFVCGKAATENYAKAFNCVSYNLAEVSQKCSVCREKVCDIKFIISND